MAWSTGTTRPQLTVLAVAWSLLFEVETPDFAQCAEARPLFQPKRHPVRQQGLASSLRSIAGPHWLRSPGNQGFAPTFWSSTDWTSGLIIIAMFIPTGSITLRFTQRVREWLNGHPLPFVAI